jgi:hypothetical protein
MKKLFVMVSIAVMLLLQLNAVGQEKGQIKLSFGPGVALPMGNFGDYYGMGIGGTVEARYFISENISIGGNLGYYSFTEKSSTELLKSSDNKATFSFMPLLGNVSYFLSEEGFKPYVAGNLGLYMWKEKVTYDVLGEWEESGSDLGAAPEVGFFMGITDKLELTANARYNVIFTGSGDGGDEKSSDGGSNMTFISINAGIALSF